MQGIDIAKMLIGLAPIWLFFGGLILWTIFFAKSDPSKTKIFPAITLISIPTQAIFLITGGLLTIFGETLRQTIPLNLEINSWPYTVMGIVFFGLGAYSSQVGFPQTIKHYLDKFGNYLSINANQVVLLAASPLFSYLAFVSAGTSRLMHSPMLAITSWTIAIIFIYLAFVNVKELNWGINRKQIMMMAALFVFAFIIRAINITSIPNTLTGDEASGALAALDYISGSSNNIFSIGWFSFPAFYFFLQSLSITIFGQTVMAIRITSALAGALTVSALYFAGHVFFNNRIALLAAIFLAGSHFHNHFSRIALNNTWDGLWFVVVLGMLWWAAKHNLRNFFLLTGLMLGLAQYFYVSARLLFVIIPVWVLLISLFDQAFYKKIAANLLVMLICSIIVMFPLALSFLAHPNEFWAPLQRVSILGDWLQNETLITGLPASQILLDQFITSAQAFTATDLRSWYTPESPILRNASAGFFILGAVLLLVQIRKKQHWLIFLWIFAFIFSGALSESTPASQRYVAVSGALALLVAYGIGESIRILAQYWPRMKKSLELLALISIMFLSLNDVLFYFQEFTHRGPYGGLNNAIAQRIVNKLENQNSDWEVAFFGWPRMGYASINSTTFLLPQITGLDMNSAWGSENNPETTASNILYVFLPGHENDRDLAIAELGFLEAKAEYDMNDNLLYWYIEINN